MKLNGLNKSKTTKMTLKLTNETFKLKIIIRIKLIKSKDWIEKRHLNWIRGQN